MRWRIALGLLLSAAIFVRCGADNAIHVGLDDGGAFTPTSTDASVSGDAGDVRGDAGIPDSGFFPDAGGFDAGFPNFPDGGPVVDAGGPPPNDGGQGSDGGGFFPDAGGFDAGFPFGKGFAVVDLAELAGPGAVGVALDESGLVLGRSPQGAFAYDSRSGALRFLEPTDPRAAIAEEAAAALGQVDLSQWRAVRTNAAGQVLVVGSPPGGGHARGLLLTPR